MPSNIAEGSQRGSDKEFGRFLLISKASLAELETQLIISEKLNYFSQEILIQFTLKIQEIDKMSRSLHLKLNA